MRDDYYNFELQQPFFLLGHWQNELFAYIHRFFCSNFCYSIQIDLNFKKRILQLLDPFLYCAYIFKSAVNYLVILNYASVLIQPSSASSLEVLHIYDGTQIPDIVAECFSNFWWEFLSLQSSRIWRYSK